LPSNTKTVEEEDRMAEGDRTEAVEEEDRMAEGDRTVVVELDLGSNDKIDL
jgi:hypothetical protein